MDYGRIHTIMNLNCLYCSLLPKLFIPRMEKRKNKSWIIYVSSVWSSGVIPYLQVYNASKGYVRILGKAV